MWAMAADAVLNADPAAHKVDTSLDRDDADSVDSAAGAFPV